MSDGSKMSEPETDAASCSNGVEMLTAQSDPFALYQKLCEATARIDQWENDFDLMKRELAEAREELLAFKRERVHMTDLFVLVNEWLDVSKGACSMRFTLRLCARELSELILKNIHLNGGTIAYSKQEETK